MPIYVCVLSNATYFVTFPDVAIVRCSRKYLFLKFSKKIRAEFLEILEVAIFFQGFARITGQFLFFKTSFADIFRNIHFFVVRFYMQCQRNSQWEELMKCRRTLQKESLRTLILQLIRMVSSNPQPSPGIPFPEVGHLSPIPTGRKTSKTSLLQANLKQPQCESCPQF